MKDKFQAGDKLFLGVDVIKSGNDGTYQIQNDKTIMWKSEAQLRTREEVAERVAKKMYAKGVEDAWEFVNKMRDDVRSGGFTTDEIESRFGTADITRIMHDTPMKKIVKVVREWGKGKNDIHVGDAVIDDYGYVGVVTNVDKNSNGNGNLYTVLYPTGSAIEYGDKKITRMRGQVVELQRMFSKLNSLQRDRDLMEPDEDEDDEQSSPKQQEDDEEDEEYADE